MDNLLKLFTSYLTISAINPLIVATGRDDVLTIKGDNFGSLTGDAKVAMRSAGSLNPSVFENLDPINILSWTDTEIKFIVPGD